MTTTSVPTIHYHAGHNMPGYLPESDVWIYATFDEAKAGQIEEMEYIADVLDSWADDRPCDGDIPCGVHGNDCGHDKANEVAAAEQDLNLESGPEWQDYAGGLSWWIQACTDEDCEVE